MKYIIGKNREQTYLFPVSLDASVSIDNEARLIDIFVDSLDISDFGFNLNFGENGRPAYHPADLLKLYIYGYMNKVRSSRDLEKECHRNIEIMWLIKSLKPDHNTISNFRKNNAEAILKVFKQTVLIAKHFNLLGNKLIAGDSTKLRAQNSKKNNFNQRKIDRHIEYIDTKLAEYNDQLAKEDGDKKTEIKAEIQKQIIRKEKYQKLTEQLEQTNQEQISTSDHESRQMIIRNNITEVAYNVQTTVDAKHNLPIDYKVTNNNDSKAMGEMLERAAEIIGNTDFTALYDKGYHTGSELKTGQTMGINLMVAIPEVASNAPNKNYNVANFIYNEQHDYYICPENKILNTNGKWYNKNRGEHREIILIKQYKTKHCKICKNKYNCTVSKENGRVIERSEYAEYIQKNKQNVEQNQKLYKRRQAIVEHPFGTIKRQWGFSYILTKQGMNRASADVGLMFVAYNLRRIINLVGFKKLLEYLRILWLHFLILLHLIKSKTINFKPINFFCSFLVLDFYLSVNRITFNQNF